MADEPPEIDVKTIDDPGIDPVTAFAKLRGHAPDHGCFLLESRKPDSEGGRYSIVGYRPLRGEGIPPGHDAVLVQSQSYDSAELPNSFAEALALGAVGNFEANNGLLSQKVQLFDDEGQSGQFIVGCAVVVFDHHEKTFTVAGRKKGNLAERIAWELTNAPDVEPLGVADPKGKADGCRTVLDENRMKLRAERAKAFVGDELDSVVLTQMFFAPSGVTDPYDVYRAWCQLSDSRFGYIVETGPTPMSAAITNFGMSDELLYVRRRGEDKKLTDIYEKLPFPSLVGAPLKDALKLRRRIEDSSHHAWGGAVGYVCPGGEAGFVLADRIMTKHSSSFWYHTGVALGPDDDPSELFERANEIAQPALAAIKAATPR
jgi:anthranilate synthase component 1